MDLSTIVYIVGALAYALLRRQSMPKPVTVPGPEPGPVVFQPSKAPLPLPTVPSPAPTFTGPILSPPSKVASITKSQPKTQSLTEAEPSDQPNTQPDTNPFPRPDRNEWRRAIVLSTLLEPRYDKGLHQ